MKRKQQQQNVGTPRRTIEPATATPTMSSEGDCIQEKVRELQGQQLRFAEAARQMREKGILSKTAAEASEKLKQGEQGVGE